MNEHRIRGRGIRRLVTPGIVILLVTLMFLSISMQMAVADDQSSSPLDKVHWVVGPAKVPLGDVAEMDLPAGYRFAGRDDTKTFMEVIREPSTGLEVGVVLPPTDSKTFWYMQLAYDNIGYVKDDEKVSLDDDTDQAILDSITTATKSANEIRRQRGWPEVSVQGWKQKPYYDNATHNLTWAIQAVSAGDSVTNYDSRILGRQGVLSAKMIISPNDLDEALPAYNTIVRAISFKQGQTYREYRPGDQVAKYGLVALISGGGAVVAAKSLKLLPKIAALVVAMIAALIAKMAKGFAKVKSLLAGNKRAPAMAGNSQASGGAPAVASSANAIISCSICGAVNRLKIERATDQPRCGRCKAVLKF